MNSILINLLLLIPSGEHEGRPTYHVVNTETNKVIEYAYIEEVRAYVLTGTFQYNEDKTQ
jgi:hypothetical protein